MKANAPTFHPLGGDLVAPIPTPEVVTFLLKFQYGILRDHTKVEALSVWSKKKIRNPLKEVRPSDLSNDRVNSSFLNHSSAYFRVTFRGIYHMRSANYTKMLVIGKAAI